MSKQTTKVQDGNSLFVENDVSKLLLGFNEFDSGDVTASGADVVLTEGMILGQISATGKLVVMASASVDGSQFPFGIVIKDKTVVDGTTEELTVVTKGRIDETKLVFDGSDDLDTAVGAATFQRTYRALLNDLGFTLKASIEMTTPDNS
jgi:hypothetical protein